jgi:hypothetical protein
MVNYNDTIIYKLCCKNPEIKDIYVGHTCNHLRRKHEHKKACNNSNRKDYNYHVYKFIRNNGGWNNWHIVMIEEYPCESKLQAEKRERHWIETLNSTLNRQIPTRTDVEYREQNREDFKRKIECECGCKILLKNLSTHKKTNKHLELMKLKTETK